MRSIAKKLMGSALRKALKNLMRSATLRGLAMRALNRMPALKMRARNIYYGLLATPAAGVEPTVQGPAERPMLPPLPVATPNTLSSPLERYSRQLVSRRK